jgi:hypothetical protein
MAVELKSEMIPVRATPSQVREFRQVAESEGMRVSAWLRDLAAQAVQQRRSKEAA